MIFRLYIKYVVTLAFAIGFVFVGYSQKKPPLPQTKADDPVVGLPSPVPIDDYIPFLFIVAFSAGVYFYSKHDKNQATNS